MEPASARPALPPIHFLAMDKYKKEEPEYTKGRSEVAAGPAPHAQSHTQQYPSGPPPPYSNLPPVSHVNAPAATPRSRTPTDSQSRSGDEKDKPVAKQSLPSIHEALGRDQREYTPSHAARPTHPHSTSPVSTRAPSGIPAPAPAAPYSHPTSHVREPYYPKVDADRDQRARLDSQDSMHRGAVQDPRHEEPSPPRRAPPSSFPRDAIPAYEPPTQPASSRPFAYGYTPYAPQSAHAPPPSSSSSSIYQPSVNHLPPVQHAGAWRVERPRQTSRDERQPGSPYSESVKRHLDMYDFELVLNEIAENSTMALDFSRSYGARMHQMQRTGPLPGTMPAISEVDDLMAKSRQTLDALTRLRESLVVQQAAYYQQAQEQRIKNENDAKRNDSVHQSEDSKTGFAGTEAKKRRGQRAAAPGRCHSCNRAETPEWRRGPDGARTLCNACGLHYAKLTRKAGANKAVIGSSNLRPKAGEAEAGET